jgi:hypothetical protein
MEHRKYVSFEALVSLFVSICISILCIGCVRATCNIVSYVGLGESALFGTSFLDRPAF